MRNISIKLTPGAGKGTEVSVDGVRIESACTAVSVGAKVGEMPWVMCTMRTRGVTEIDGEADVRVDDRTHQALVVLGWTPPDGP